MVAQHDRSTVLLDGANFGLETGSGTGPLAVLVAGSGL